MIAERPLVAENSAAEVDLFAGLSFPDVPCAPIEVSARQSSTGVINPPPFNPQHIPLAPILSGSIINSEPEQKSRKAGNLSALYSSEVSVSYPDPIQWQHDVYYRTINYYRQFLPA
mgnify:CR=1 FL=1